MKNLYLFGLLFVILLKGCTSLLNTENDFTGNTIHSKYPDECDYSYNCPSPDRQECKLVESAKRKQCVYTEEYMEYKRLLDLDSECQSQCLRDTETYGWSQKESFLCVDDCSKKYDWRKYGDKY